MEKKPQHAWFDIDKTLKGQGKNVSETVIGAFKRIPYRGVNTARGIESAESVIAPEHVNLPSIVLLGAEVWQPDGSFVHGFTFNEVERTRLAQFIQNNSSLRSALFYPNSERLSYAFAPDIQRYEIYNNKKTVAQVTQQESVFIQQIRDLSSSMILVNFSCDMRNFMPTFIEEHFTVTWQKDGHECFITKKGVHKGSTLAWVCNELDISPKDVLTAGDDPATDCYAFEYSQGIAVGEFPLLHSIHTVENPEALAYFLHIYFS